MTKAKKLPTNAQFQILDALTGVNARVKVGTFESNVYSDAVEPDQQRPVFRNLNRQSVTVLIKAGWLQFASPLYQDDKGTSTGWYVITDAGKEAHDDYQKEHKFTGAVKTFDEKCEWNKISLAKRREERDSRKINIETSDTRVGQRTEVYRTGYPKERVTINDSYQSLLDTDEIRVPRISVYANTLDVKEIDGFIEILKEAKRIAQHREHELMSQE